MSKLRGNLPPLKEPQKNLEYKDDEFLGISVG